MKKLIDKEKLINKVFGRLQILVMHRGGYQYLRDWEKEKRRKFASYCENCGAKMEVNHD